MVFKKNLQRNFFRKIIEFCKTTWVGVRDLKKDRRDTNLAIPDRRDFILAIPDWRDRILAIGHRRD